MEAGSTGGSGGSTGGSTASGGSSAGYTGGQLHLGRTWKAEQGGWCMGVEGVSGEFWVVLIGQETLVTVG